jgi:hypothetical protein
VDVLHRANLSPPRWNSEGWTGDHRRVIRRTLVLLALAAALLLLPAVPAAAHVEVRPDTAGAAAETVTTLDLPRTAGEADQRDDGNTDSVPWIIGSAVAALAAILIGGTILKRRQG